jgi:stringent starvation protein B
VKYLIRQWIEALHHSSQCARLMVDATVEGVVVPQHVKEQWGEAMPLDLDPAYPLELSMDDDGLDCVLSFGGPFACHLPWHAIYVVQDRDSQLGVVIEENLPPRFALETEEHVAHLRRYPDADADGEPDADADADGDPDGDADPDGDPDADDDADADTEGGEEAAEGLDDELVADEASKRRATFRVIDGGKS